MLRSLVGSEMCIRDRLRSVRRQCHLSNRSDPLLAADVARLRQQLPEPSHLHHLQQPQHRRSSKRWSRSWSRSRAFDLGLYLGLRTNIPGSASRPTLWSRLPPGGQNVGLCRSQGQHCGLSLESLVSISILISVSVSVSQVCSRLTSLTANIAISPSSTTSFDASSSGPCSADGGASRNLTRHVSSLEKNIYHGVYCRSPGYGMNVPM